MVRRSAIPICTFSTHFYLFVNVFTFAITSFVSFFPTFVLPSTVHNQPTHLLLDFDPSFSIVFGLILSNIIIYFLSLWIISFPSSISSVFNFSFLSLFHPHQSSSLILQCIKGSLIISYIFHIIIRMSYRVVGESCWLLNFILVVSKTSNKERKLLKTSKN